MQNEKAFEFIKKAKKVHGDKYDYSLVIYKGSFKKVKILCKEHGVFEQTATNHLNGSGCKKCNSKLMTIEEFIERAKKTHGDKYDYSLVVYQGSLKKIKIICKKHGVFEQFPLNHLKHSGCRKCAGKITTTEEFVERAKKVHGDKFDYSLVVYKNSKKKIEIKCKKHGVFEQTAISHLSGNGCIMCAGSKKRNLEEFLENAKKVHGDKYDYSLVIYKNALTKVKIICKEHGIFEQVVASHLNGSGCKRCSGKSTLTTKEFIERAKKVHGDKYDYSSVVYINSSQKIKIICKKHGVFEQTPYNHLKDIGCKRCSGNFKLTTEEFIEGARKIHGDKYDYSLAKYINNKVKIKIICRKHGVFDQAPQKHIYGIQGCPKCSGKGIEYLPYEEARAFIKTLGFKSQAEFYEYCKSGLKPDNIPANPDQYYKF